MRAPHVAGALAGLLAWCIAASSAYAQNAPPRAIDPLHSRAAFSVTHVFVEHVTGTVPILDGTIIPAPDSPLPMSISARLDPAKVTSGDPDRDAALRGPDFFDVKTDPVWTFVSTAIVPVDGAHFGVDGNLTIHGVTTPVHLDATIRGDASRPSYHAAGRIDRRAFRMAVTRLDPAIGQMVEITLDIAVK
jgi:polyisoprenoid-binding protein YceI